MNEFIKVITSTREVIDKDKIEIGMRLELFKRYSIDDNWISIGDGEVVGVFNDSVEVATPFGYLDMTLDAIKNGFVKFHIK